MYSSMLHSWGQFLLVYLVIGAVPSIVLAVRGFGWNMRFFGLSLLVAWTGGGWLIMTFIAVMKRRPGLALYQVKNGVRRHFDS